MVRQVNSRHGAVEPRLPPEVPVRRGCRLGAAGAPALAEWRGRLPPLWRDRPSALLPGCSVRGTPDPDRPCVLSPYLEVSGEGLPPPVLGPRRDDLRVLQDPRLQVAARHVAHGRREERRLG